MGPRSEQRPLTRSPRPPCKCSTCAALTAVAYFALAQFSLLFIVVPERIAGFWLPNGLLIGVMLVRPKNDWPALLGCSVLANAAANLTVGVSVPATVGLSLANGIESWLAAWLLVRYAGPRVTFCRLREVFGFVAIAGLPACAVGAFLGAMVVCLLGGSPEFWPVWRVWMVADLMGMLLVTPLVIAWTSTAATTTRMLSRARWYEALLLISTMIAASFLIFAKRTEQHGTILFGAYLLFPLLLWGALRFGVLETSSAIFASSIIAVWFTAHGRGPFAVNDGLVAEQMLSVQLFLMVAVLTKLVVVAAIAERKLAQEQLELAIRGTDVGIWDWNMLSDEVYLSPRWKSLLGFADHEIANDFDSWESRLHPDDRERALATLRDYLEGRTAHYELEHRLRHRDGTYRWVLSCGLAVLDAAGHPIRIAGSNLDITAIKRTEEALRESERHFVAAFDDSPIGMDIVDLRGRFVRVNAAYCRMLGYSAEELTGKHFRDVTHPADLLPDEVSLQEFLTGERKIYQTEKRYIRSDGQIVWALLNVTVVADSEGLPLHFFGQVQDITPLKISEAELRRQAFELERSNQELDEFAYIATHDLKAPLRGIENLSKWLAEDAGSQLPEESQEHLRLLRKRVARMERLLDDLLEYSRAGQLFREWKTVDVGQMVRSIVELLAIPSGFSVVILNDLPVLMTHQAPLELVLRNLIDNAVKHHHRGTGRIEVASQSHERFVEFTVQDDGPGIPKEYHEKVFKMFQTLRPRDELESSGIGLAIVKKVVERQGGRIFLDSEEGQGTTIRFTWPRHDSLLGTDHAKSAHVDSVG